jgi:bifunctional non-homologous end joining protein LigD
VVFPACLFGTAIRLLRRNEVRLRAGICATSLISPALAAADEELLRTAHVQSIIFSGAHLAGRHGDIVKAVKYEGRYVVPSGDEIAAACTRPHYQDRTLTMPGKLSAYNAKRNFGITPEPRGELAPAGEQLRFVVQKHAARRLHYDFRLELDGTLKSWAVPKGPSLDPSEKRLAVHVEDHPLDYIDFEGDIPAGQYGAGHVDVWDSGWWEPQGDPGDGYRAGKLKFRLHGDKLHGGWTLVRTRLQASGDKEQWLLIKEKDEQARPHAEMEGLIGKRADSAHVETERIKLKCRQRQEFVIAGFTEPQGTRKFFGALLLAVYADDGSLHYAGRVGTGFDRPTLQTVFRRLQPLQQFACPFAQTPAGIDRAHTHWVKPQLVAEISFAEWTQDNLLRQAVFHGLRLDKPAMQIRRERATNLPAAPAKHSHSRGKGAGDDDPVEGVRITHAERVIDVDSGLTKGDLARYYATVAPHLLPHLARRPVYLLRCPEGIAGERFFQKHSSGIAIPGIGTLPPSLDPDHGPLMVIESTQALLGAVQMGTVELHVCNATADSIERPDCMVFDLDPDPALPWTTVVEGARLMKVLLDELDLKSFLKTSGGKGLHLIVPLARRHDWDEVGAFSKTLAQHMARTLPRHFGAKMGAHNRVGKIFVDYLRNQRQASTVAPYSARARPGLPVAAPIAWDELAQLSGAAMWTIASLPQRLARQERDPWHDYAGTRQRLTAAMKKKLGM